MNTKLVVPLTIKEEIRTRGKKEARRNREATGILVGSYSADNDIISIFEMYPLNSQIGDGTFLGSVRDFFGKLFYFPRAACVFWRAHNAENHLRDLGSIPAQVFYHSHPPRRPNNSWSYEDFSTIGRYEGRESKWGTKLGALLYDAATDKFEALDTRTRRMRVSDSYHS